ncbi:MAG: glycoside hydrolase family 15 protein [Rhizobiales bacterium]|nr:glycoside hydrolase family 15 protein [Hyphomicrobiales bacterium]
MSQRIEDYAIIGDCETAALVARNGSIDWLCLPRFDSGACFAALLGTSDHGRWLIAPAGAPEIKRRYLPDTLILETTFASQSGIAKLIDFMPLRGDNVHLVRIVRGEHGRVTFNTELVIRFGYGEIVPWVTRMDGVGLRAVAGPDMAELWTLVPLHGENFKTIGEFAVEAGESASFILTYGPSHRRLAQPADAAHLLHLTESFWHTWIGKCCLSGSWADAIRRSLITLKALTYTPTGGLVAAPTTSLPELLGGQRNWDYRYCWLRDATMTLLALMNTGYHEEAREWRNWLLRAVAGKPDQIQTMYGIAGERRLVGMTLPWLPGYAEATPVRVGNDAYRQLQLDVYGELIDALHQGREGALAPDESGWALQVAILNHLATRWSEKDHGIWEVRSDPEHFTYSKVMAWVAFDRAIKSAEIFNLQAPVDHWRELREAIHADVCLRGFDARLGCFVRSYGSKQVDASLLLLPAVGFLPPDDQRMVRTVDVIEQRLLRDGLLMRYDTIKTADGLPPGEGVFLACSFWLVDAYVLMGRHDDARMLFERLLNLRNDVGLLSEEYDPAAGRLLGNFPQALSHLSLVNSACNLSQMKKPVNQRTGKLLAGRIQAATRVG